MLPGIAQLVTALDLPGSCRLDQRVPKKLVIEHGAPTAADKRHISDGIDELHWLAALKPTTMGVPEFRDQEREYLEIAVLQLVLRPAAKAPRLMELVHRAVPYPVLLLFQHGDRFGLSATHKRWSQGESGKIVLEGEVVAANWDRQTDCEFWGQFRDALALGKQPRASLYALYQGWIDIVLALHAARITGAFALPASHEGASARSEALREIAKLDEAIARLRAAATKEKQVARVIALNLELKRAEANRATAYAKL